MGTLSLVRQGLAAQPCDPPPPNPQPLFEQAPGLLLHGNGACSCSKVMRLPSSALFVAASSPVAGLTSDSPCLSPSPLSTHYSQRPSLHFQGLFIQSWRHRDQQTERGRGAWRPKEA